ncbi:MAG: CBS domain-containing protein [Bdellovibrionota bacterium]
MQISDLIPLKQKQLSISSTAGLAEALSMFGESGARHAAVMGPNGLPIGVLSAKDLRFGSEGETVTHWMTMAPLTIRDSASLKECAEKMLAENAEAILVIDDSDKYLGAVGLEDFVEKVLPYLGGEPGEVLTELTLSPVVTEAMRELNSAGI